MRSAESLIAFLNKFNNADLKKSHDSSQKALPVIGDGNCAFRAIIQDMLLEGILNPTQKEKITDCLTWLFSEHGNTGNTRKLADQVSKKEFNDFIDEFEGLNIDYDDKIVDFYKKYFPYEYNHQATCYDVPPQDKYIKFLAYCLRQEAELPPEDKKEYAYVQLSCFKEHRDDHVLSDFARKLYAKGFNLIVHFSDSNLNTEYELFKNMGVEVPEYEAQLRPGLIDIHILIKQLIGDHYEVLFSRERLEHALANRVPVSASISLSQQVVVAPPVKLTFAELKQKFDESYASFEKDKLASIAANTKFKESVELLTLSVARLDKRLEKSKQQNGKVNAQVGLSQQDSNKPLVFSVSNSKEDITHEPFYKAYEELRNMDVEAFDSVYVDWLRKQYVDIFYDVNDQSSYMLAVYKYINTIKQSDLLNMLMTSPLYGNLPYIEDLLEKHHDNVAKLLVQKIKKLYNALERVNSAKNDHLQIFAELLNLMTRAALNSDAHDMIVEKIKASKKFGETVVLSIGSGGNSEEICPSFAKELANTGPVTIYNYDNSKFVNDIIQDVVKKLPNTTYEIDVELLPATRKMPSIYVNTCGMYSNDATYYEMEKYKKIKENKHIKHQDLINQESSDIIERYAQALMARKQVNANYKVIILYSCCAAFQKYEKILAAKLIEYGFRQGEDLELVHAYFASSPAIVYRGKVDAIPYPNPILNTVPSDEKIDLYDNQSQSYIFARLENLKTLFQENLLTSKSSFKPNGLI